VALDVSVTARGEDIRVSPALRPAPPCVMVIFGASGDLTHRKLIPALFDLYLDGLLGKQFAVLGFSRSALSDEDFRRSARDGIAEFSTSEVPDAAWQEFSAALHYMSGQFDEPASYQVLRERLERIDVAHGTQGNRVFYLATPPELFPNHHGAAW
jgi:glucose-6-phosphate 1-dehydrogenase